MASSDHLEPSTASFPPVAGWTPADITGLLPNWRWQFHRLSRPDGCAIRYGFCRLGSGPIDRYLVFLNGRSDWMEKYEFLPTELNLPPTTAILSLDHRGQGSSEGVRAYVDSYDTYCDDLVAVLAETGVDKKPYDLISHSMGGLIALTAYTKNRIEPEQMILSAPLLRLPARPIPHVLARPLAKIMLATRLGEFKFPAGNVKEATPATSVLTSWPLALRKIQASDHPLPFVTPAWIDATFEALDWLFTPEALASITAPITLFKAGREQVVDNEGLEAWQQHCKLNQVVVEVVTFPDAQHEILNERFDYRHSAFDYIRRKLLAGA